jgi:hypothetical protein
MTQITSIELGLIAMCVATVPLSLAQTPRTRTIGSNQVGTTTIRAPAGPSGLSGNSTSAPQLGTNFRSSISTAPNTNIAAHIGINPGARPGISSPTGGITGGTVPGLAASSGNAAGATQIRANARDATSTTTRTNAEAHTAAAPASVTTLLPQAITVPTQTPLPNNDALSSNFSTPGQSPSPLPSASVSPTPTPTPTPAQSL